MRTSLVTFVDFTSTLGPARTRIPGARRDMYLDPHRHPWDYYGPVVRAVTRGFTEGPLEAQLARALDVAVAGSDQMRFRGRVQHFVAIADGARQLHGAATWTGAADAPSLGVWRHDELQLRVAPHLLVHRRDRRTELWYLYVKEQPLTQGAADPALVVLGDQAREAGLDVLPRVVDVRRARKFGLSANRCHEALRTHVQLEAETFARLWLTAA